MSDYRSCLNCGKRACSQIMVDAEEDTSTPCDFWVPLPCPKCGGILSEPRTDGQRRWRHCYACHFEFEEETP